MKRYSREMQEFNKNFTIEILMAMPEEKKRMLEKQMERTGYLTTYFGLDYQDVDVYKEGWYIKMDGCQSSFRIWVGDNDGEFVFGKRKPKDSKLSYLHTYTPGISEQELCTIVGWK